MNIRILVSGAYEINGFLYTFHQDVKHPAYVFKKNHFPEHLVGKVVKTYLKSVDLITCECPLQWLCWIFLSHLTPWSCTLPNSWDYCLHAIEGGKTYLDSIRSLTNGYALPANSCTPDFETAISSVFQLTTLL